jgi:hypothetical protein
MTILAIVFGRPVLRPTRTDEMSQIDYAGLVAAFDALMIAQAEEVVITQKVDERNEVIS